MKLSSHPAIATKVVAAQSLFSRWLGLIQRMAIERYTLWLIVCAMTLLRKGCRRGASACRNVQ